MTTRLRISVTATAAILGALLVGCSAVEESTTPEPAGSAAASGSLEVEPVYDTELGLWLSDGWPVPAPDATFDPNYRWTSANEIASAVGTCLQDDGWDVVVGGIDGGFESKVPPEQQSAYQDAMKACQIELGMGTNPGRELNSDLAREEYAAQERLAGCLRNAGANPPALPSYQVYEESLLSSSAIYSLYDLMPDKREYLSICPDPVDTWGFNG